MKYHAGARKVILFGGGVAGGCGRGYIDDVWEYDFALDSWKQRRPVDRGLVWPVGMDNHVMAYDPDRRRMWIFAGTCGGGFGYYDYATNSFTQVGDKSTAEPNEPLNGALDPAFVYGDGKIIVFSGEPAWMENPGERTSTFDPTKTANKGWTIMQSSSTPRPRMQMENAAAWDPIHHKMIIFGGQDFASRPDLDDTWEYDLATNAWTKPPHANGANPHPPASSRHGLVWDSTYNVVIMTPAGPYDTWIYDPSTHTWSKVANAGFPDRRVYGIAYDPVNDVTLVFSGSGPDGNNAGGLYAFRYQPPSPTPLHKAR